MKYLYLSLIISLSAASIYLCQQLAELSQLNIDARTQLIKKEIDYPFLRLKTIA